MDTLIRTDTEHDRTLAQHASSPLRDTRLRESLGVFHNSQSMDDAIAEFLGAREHPDLAERLCAR